MRLSFLALLAIGFSVATAEAATQPKWSRRLPGAVMNLSASKTGDLLISTRPDPDIEGTSDKSFLIRMDSKGKVGWQKQTEFTIKEQDISDDGKLLLTTTHADEVQAYNANGKLLWTRQGTCKPFILNVARRIVCYHDEDVDPQIAFEIFDYAGKKLAEFPIEGDILAFKLSSNQNHFAIGLTGGRVLLFDASGKKLWERKLNGEVIDLAVSSGTKPKVAVLSREKTQSIQILQEKTTVAISEQGLPDLVYQIEISPNGSQVFFAGVFRQKGLSVGALSVAATAGLKWVRDVSPMPIYYRPMIVREGAILVGIEGGPGEHRNQLVRISTDGKAESPLLLPTEESALYYTHRLAGKRIAVATDDGQVHWY